MLASWPGIAQAAPVAAQAVERPASAQVRTLADRVVAAGDAFALPFLIVDKIAARVFAFDPRGLQVGSAPVLLGLARGDVTVPGIASRRLADVTPAQRITPAGRFQASLGRNLDGHDILWVDYEAAISLHRVATANPAERRLQRLATASVGDNRISYGCINVPAAFFDTVVLPLFTPADGLVYILPETSPFRDLIAATASAPSR